MGVADVEANLSEEKLLQVDMTDGGKVSKEEFECISCYFLLRDTSETFALLPPAPPPSPRSLLLHEDSTKQSGLLHLQLPAEEPGVGGRDGGR